MRALQNLNSKYQIQTTNYESIIPHFLANCHGAHSNEGGGVPQSLTSGPSHPSHDDFKLALLRSAIPSYTNANPRNSGNRGGGGSFRPPSRGTTIRPAQDPPKSHFQAQDDRTIPPVVIRRMAAPPKTAYPSEDFWEGFTKDILRFC